MARVNWLAVFVTTATAGCFMVSVAQAASEVAPPRIDAVVSTDHADLWIRQHFSSHKKRSKLSGTLTSYQTVCASRVRNNVAVADICHRSSTLCPSTATTKQTATWIMTAPATPTPRPNDWTNTGRITCRITANGQPAPVITGRDFRRLPIPPATITVQPDPAKSPTLINIPTNLYADDTPRVLPTTVLGQPVRVRATPTTYTWRYGDGTSNTTTNPGGPYPNLAASHTYLQPGRYAITLTTTYTGQYSVAGGPWQPIAGTAAVTGEPTQIRALEARNQLVPAQPN